MNKIKGSNSYPVAVIGAMPQEVSALVASIIAIDQIDIAGLTIYTGLLNKVPIVVMQSGIGKVNAAIATTLLIERFSPRAIINTGSAGGIGYGLSIGDIVIGDSVAHHDVDVTAFGYHIGQMAQMPVDYPSDSHLISMAHEAANDFFTTKIHQGQIVSGDQFIASSERFSTIREFFPKALAVEMEASAIAQTCYRFGLPFVVIRAISDLANETANVSFEDFIEQAGRRSASMVMKMIGSLSAY